MAASSGSVTSGEAFSRYGRYYDLLYRDKDYVAEADYVASSLRRAEPEVRSILEFGAGTGRHGRLLAGRGFDVVGIERSDSMVAAALAASGEASGEGVGDGNFVCRQADIRTVKLKRRFDAVISLFHVVGYQTTNAELVQTFANAARHLRPRGLFLFDVWHGPAVLSERPAVRVKRIEDDETRLWRIAEPDMDSGAGVVTVRYTMLAASKTDACLSTFQEEHRMRYLFPAEIDLLALSTGFAVERTEEFMTGNQVSERTWGVAYLLRKCS